MASTSGSERHVSLIQSWEALYRHQVSFFSSHVANSQETSNVQFQNLKAYIKHKILQKESNVFQNLQSKLSESVSVYPDFMSYFQGREQADATSQFWLEFVHRDLFHYVGFLAVRLRQFDIRNAAVRKLTPIFHAMDRPTCLKLVSFHMAAMKQQLSNIAEKLKEGGFAVSITVRNGSCVSLDETHGMPINKEVKMVIETTGMGSLSLLVHIPPF